MPYRSGLLPGSAALALAGVIAGAGPSSASTVPAPTSTPACPPVLPLSATASAVTATSVTLSYAMFLTPPCGYVQALWNAAAHGDQVTVGNTPYNATGAAGGTTTFGMVVVAGGAPGTITPACTR